MFHTALLLSTLIAASLCAAQEATAPARIDGVVLAGGKPSPNEKVLLFNMRNRKQLPAIQTDPEGRFSFTDVPPGIYGIGCLREYPQRASQFTLNFTATTHTRCLCIDPGETLQIQIGAAGRTLTGRLTAPPNVNVAIAWQGTATRHLSSVVDIPSPPEELSDIQKEAWFNEQLKTPQFQAIMEQRQTLIADIKEDGQFTIADVPPGKYELNIEVADDATGDDKAIGAAKTEITVTPGAEPQDLGQIPVQLFPRIEIGAPAPDFKATTLDGAPITLSQFKGKLVLLDFWATWCAPCRMEVPHLKEVHTKYGDSVTLIGLSLDRDKKALQAFIKEKDMPWPQIYLRDFKDTDIADAYQAHSIPSMFLIGPEGNILAANLRGPAIATAIEKALAAQK